MDVCSPISGRVVEILVAVGDSVADGDELLYVESMKMEVPVHSPASGRVDAVLVATGDAIEDGARVVVVL